MEDKITMQPHFRIETSLSEGIKYLLQSSPSQIVAVDNFKTLKFYEFFDKQKREEEEKQAKYQEQIRQYIKDMIDKYDVDCNGMLNYEEVHKFMGDWADFMGFGWATDLITPDFFKQFDTDNSG